MTPSAVSWRRAAPVADEPLEVRERLGDREAPRRRLQVAAEERERDLVARPRLGGERRRGRLEPLAMVGEELTGSPGGVGDGLPVPGDGERRLERDRLLERVEVVAERVGPALRPEADGRRDAVEEMIGGDEGPVAVEHQLAVRMPGRGDGLPAVHEVAGLEQLGVGLEADERPVHRPLLDQLGGHLVGDAVPAEPVDEHVGPVVSAPDERALLVVEPPLGHRRAGELGDVAGGADVIRVEVGDEDPGDRPGEPVELGGPPVARVGEAEAGVHERPAVLARAAGRRGRAPAASAAGA